MHDAAHKRLFTNPNWNDYVSQLLLAAPVFFNVMAYRTFHIKHHKAPLAADDPDISLIGGYPVSRQSFVRKILRDLSGLSYFKFIRYFISRARAERGRAVRSDGKRSGPSALMANIMILAVNALLAVILASADALWAYFVLWLLPSLTVLQVLLRIRGITEHAGYEPNADQRLNARTVVNPWQTFFFAPNGVNYHIEHHLYPSVPWYHLASVHKLLLARGVLPAKNCYTSYTQVIRELVR